MHAAQAAIASAPPRGVFVTGGTGYIGSRLIPALLARGHRVTALARRESAAALPGGCTAVTGDVLDDASFRDRLGGADTVVHLVGVAHPGPAKAAQFLSVDLASVRSVVSAAMHAGVSHFVYLSVAQPAPVMRAYVAARAQGEVLVRASGLAATLLRPWYVLGPGHRWPLVLLPAYWAAQCLPATRDTARRLGLVTLPQMLASLVLAVENPATEVRVIEVPEIRNAVHRLRRGHDRHHP
jgi:uncharacterized protein YbjT (DUF2867 family)